MKIPIHIYYIYIHQYIINTVLFGDIVFWLPIPICGRDFDVNEEAETDEADVLLARQHSNYSFELSKRV